MEKIGARQTARVLFAQLRPHRARFVLFFSFVVGTSLLELTQPIIAKWIVDGLTRPGAASFETVRAPFLAFAAALVALWAIYRVQSVIEADLIRRTNAPSVADVFEALMRQSAAFFSDASSGELVHNAEKFGDVIERAMNMLSYETVPAIMFVATFAVALSQRSWLFGVVFLAWVCGILLIQSRIASHLQSSRQQVTELWSKATGRLADAAANATTIKIFAQEAEETAGMRAVLRAAGNKGYEAAKKEEWLWALQNGLFILLEIVAMWLVLHAWASGNASIGDVVLVQAYLAMLFGYLSRQWRVFRNIPRLLADASHAATWLSQVPSVIDAPDAKPIKVSAGEVSFDDVRFGYKDGRTVLKGFTLDIKPGEKVAFVGPSGAGKSTIVKLLYRFYDPQKGSVRIDGQDISLVTQESLRRSLALVPQDPVLFHRTILENLRYANPKAKMEEVVAASKRAHCAEFIKDLPDGYDSLVGDRGVKLSGGERQRVALARAILADAPILVLDEATSSLDSASEALIKDALHEVMKGKTVLVIAHRLSTIMEMDRIVVMDHGRVIDQGTHAELIKREGKYKQLWDLQSGGYLPEVDE